MTTEVGMIDLRSEIQEILKEREITKSELREALKRAFEVAYSRENRMDSPPPNFRVDVDLGRGKVGAFLVKRVLTEARDPSTEISIADVRALGHDLPARSFYQELVDFGNLSRIAIREAMRTLNEGIAEAERVNLTKKSEILVETNVYGEIFKVVRDTAWVEIGKIEGILRRSERIGMESRKQKVKMGVRAYAHGVTKDRSGRPQLLLSRTHPGFLRGLMEENIPEIAEGQIEVKNVRRTPGVRAKVAVHSVERGLEPLGACIGPAGRRINAVIKELSNEKIDVIKWDEKPRHYVANAMRPVHVGPQDVILLHYLGINTEEGMPPRRKAIVVVPLDQKSKAIGNEGENVGLAARITGWAIDVWSRTDFENLPDKALSDDAFEMPPFILEALEGVGVLLVRDLFTYDEEGLEKIEGLGKEGARILLQFLDDVGVTEGEE
ncbi:transcription termination factor NusA [bacterium]|nr:transcription termination factor NusA [bacterium]